MQVQNSWFGPYRIQYCLYNIITFLMIVDKFDPNPILVNINKLKPYRFQDTTPSRGLESIVERGRDIACHNPNLGFTGKARAWKCVGRKCNPKVTFTLLKCKRV
jgi:hypothetical protein